MNPNEPTLNSTNRPTTPESPPTVSPPKPSKAQKHQGLKDVLSIAGVLLTALLLAFCLVSFVFQSYQVDGPSMETTLNNNDHLIVWKVSRTWARITGHPYIPKRGDVVIFNEPGLAEAGQSDNKQLIKRVIGLPGDRVVVKNGTVTIYNTQHPGGFQPDASLPYGKVIPTTAGNIDVTLEKKQIFVCGDNRPDSLDSRVFGPVDLNNVVGKLVLRVLPINGMKLF